MVRVLTVNNFLNHGGKSWVRLLEDALSANRVRGDTIDRNVCSASRFKDYDGIILSESQAMLSKKKTLQEFSRELEAVQDTSTPLLGICFGHQLLSKAFGSNVVRAGNATRRSVESELLVEDPLFAGLPEKMSVYEAHYEVVESVPRGFRLLARSPTSAVGAIKHKKLPLYGVQFHPEKNSPLHPDGAVVIANFIGNLG